MAKTCDHPLHGITVVVDTAGPRIYIGRYHSENEAGVLLNDVDPEGDLLTATLGTDVANGVLVFNGNGTFDYTPNADFFGTDSFIYTATKAILLAAHPTASQQITAARRGASAEHARVLAQLAARVAIEAPERIASLVLISPTGFSRRSLPSP